MTTETINTTRKERLERLIDLAQAYRSWSRKELAEELGRDATKLIPESGNPKFDMILRLSEVLDWSLDEVSEWIWYGNDINKSKKSNKKKFTFLDLDKKAQDAHRIGDHKKMISLAHSALDVAQTPEERARSYNRAAGGWDGVGRFKRVLRAAQAGLREHPIPNDLRLLLQSTAANAHYTLWQLDESQGMAQRVVDYYVDHKPETDRAKVAQAHGLYVLGHTHRRLIDIEPDLSSSYAQTAKSYLEKAEACYEELARTIHTNYGGIANTCRCGILEVEVFLGSIDAREAIARIFDVINSIIDPTTFEKGDWLESYGWWCIVGCNITLRHIAEDRDIQRFMAMFTNKADEISERLDHWAMRERVFSMQFEGHQRLIGWTGQSIPIVIDNDDVRLITGTMGRFPQFREIGWSILNCGNIVQEA
jgi:ribosome-binding protein aMBF1 (putative translation factor)